MSQGIVMSEEQAYALLAHLVVSAEICTFEPHYYGTFRLIDGASKLLEIMLAGGASDQAWLASFKQEIDQKKGWMMWDREGYFQFLYEAAGTLAGELKRRANRVDPEGVAATDGD